MYILWGTTESSPVRRVPPLYQQSPGRMEKDTLVLVQRMSTSSIQSHTGAPPQPESEAKPQNVPCTVRGMHIPVPAAPQGPLFTLRNRGPSGDRLHSMDLDKLGQAIHEKKYREDCEALFSNHSWDELRPAFTKKKLRGSCVSLVSEHFLLHWLPRTFWSFVTAVIENANNTGESARINSDAESGGRLSLSTGEPRNQSWVVDLLGEKEKALVTELIIFPGKGTKKCRIGPEWRDT